LDSGKTDYKVLTFFIENRGTCILKLKQTDDRNKVTIIQQIAPSEMVAIFANAPPARKKYKYNLYCIPTEGGDVCRFRVDLSESKEPKNNRDTAGSNMLEIRNPLNGSGNQVIGNKVDTCGKTVFNLKIINLTPKPRFVMLYSQFTTFLDDPAEPKCPTLKIVTNVANKAGRLVNPRPPIVEINGSGNNDANRDNQGNPVVSGPLPAGFTLFIRGECSGDNLVKKCSVQIKKLRLYYDSMHKNKAGLFLCLAAIFPIHGKKGLKNI
jgi:hypothetical protein